MTAGKANHVLDMKQADLMHNTCLDGENFSKRL